MGDGGDASPPILLVPYVVFGGVLRSAWISPSPLYCFTHPDRKYGTGAAVDALEVSRFPAASRRPSRLASGCPRYVPLSVFPGQPKDCRA